MRPDPVGQPLRPGGFGIGVVGSAQHGDKDLGFFDLPGHDIDHGDSGAAIVTKSFSPARCVWRMVAFSRRRHSP